ncbi:uncharacterized protein LOC143552673 [Bidens hawaiensis]|uniref:uncharacterized protein LOC143552673 n=1 Tax=Bidens hawaiensis TaxID=980011 RepID=UPI00404A32A0
MVESRITLGSTIKNLKWNWKREPTIAEEVGELFGLLEQIHDYGWAQGVDSWKWVGGGPTNFTVYAVKQLFISDQNYSDFYKMRWNGWIPLKCNVLAWRAELDRLPTSAELTKRGMILQDINCPLCGDYTESSAHLFTACIFALEMWDRVASWYGLPPLYAFEVRDLLSLTKGLKLQKHETRTVHGIVITTLWCIWIARNEMVFQRKKVKVVDVIAKIKASSFFWIRNRSKFKCIEWKDWYDSPLILL